VLYCPVSVIFLKLYWNVLGDLPPSPGAIFIPTAAVTSAGAAVIVVSPTHQKADSSSPDPGTCINSMPHLLKHELQLHFFCRYGLLDHHLGKFLEPFLM